MNQIGASITNLPNLGVVQVAFPELIINELDVVSQVVKITYIYWLSSSYIDGVFKSLRSTLILLSFTKFMRGLSEGVETICALLSVEPQR